MENYEQSFRKKNISRLYFIYFSNALRDGNGFRLLACPWSATSTGGSFGPHMTRIWNQHAPRPRSAWDPGPGDPRNVPWDQNFLVKFFLISYEQHVILCILCIWFKENVENCEKQVIFARSLCNGKIFRKWPVFRNFRHFLQNKSTKCIE